MHDPNTVAFEIKYPWFQDRPWPKKLRERALRDGEKFTWEHMTPEQRKGRSSMWPKGYRRSFITIWHKDPEKGGSDDSCGFGFPRITNEQLKRLKNAAWHEGHYPHYLKCCAREFTGSMVEAEALYRGLLLWVADVLDIKLTYEKAARIAARMIHTPNCVHPSRSFCFEPGYHTNREQDTTRDREEVFVGVMCGAARLLLDMRRPWYRHPRWHVHHWRLQIHPWQYLKRGLFDRCAFCRKGFKFGESVCGDWGGTKIWHDRCSGVSNKVPDNRAN